MSLFFMALLQGATTALPVDFDLARLRRADRLATVPRCDTASSATEIVVCASLYKHQPLPDGWIEDDPDETPDDARVTRGTGMAALTPVGACGMFAGDRDCSKAEMRHFGYGRGRDPVTFVGKLAGKLLHPD